ncbi:unnamed protein product [Adineta steineri]|uniref:Metalloendopeptidase OMA1, mitochondrial n=1 Tax=Adineta steineri TaxID=433720 RepID=A0A814DJI9_9BILA|nr:unnamed protein product [Adineta steineri]CAF0956357.1 unnamed protein product [Adineta steineri]CAF0961372.1 unnamed protein product [Adineta steineri]CAF1040802.1 unnamed protein product [Adineta steineri]CAF1048513.1 unnamed protein product [Adineta steineri]
MPVKLERKHALPLTLAPIMIALGFVLFKLYTASKVTNPETGRVARVGIDPEQEQRLGLEAYAQVKRDEAAKIVQSGPDVELVKRVTNRLARAAAEKATVQYNWEVSVIQSNEKNAFCLPGGKIVVYTGIIPIAKNEAGLATVLGHEMAHATSRHGAERLFRSELTKTILGGFQGGLAQMDPAQRQTIMGALGAGAKYGATLPFSRTQESEADHIGLIYMARAGYDPKEAVAFWQRMDEQVGKGGSPPQFMSDHPSHNTRIGHLQTWMPEAEKEFASHHQHNAPGA